MAGSCWNSGLLFIPEVTRFKSSETDYITKKSILYEKIANWQLFSVSEAELAPMLFTMCQFGINKNVRNWFSVSLIAKAD